MIPKSGYRFSEKIMRQQKLKRDDDSKKNHRALGKTDFVFSYGSSGATISSEWPPRFRFFDRQVRRSRSADRWSLSNAATKAAAPLSGRGIRSAWYSAF
jgi:hypothetical protein